MVLSLVPRFSVALIAASVIGCGGFGYRHFTVTDPATGADSSIVVASLRLRVHVADERVDVRLENSGADPIVVDWASATLTILVSPGDEIPHRVVRSTILGEGAAMSNNPRAFPFATPTYVASPFPDQAPARFARDDERLALAPHTVLEETLYPAEHVRMRTDGRWIVGPLFCRQPPKSPQRIAVTFPAMIEGRWRTVAVEGIVSP